MAPPAFESSHSNRLAARLQAARAHRFVGRTEDLNLFRDALSIGEPPFAVLFLHGPGGVGKTTLLDSFARLATDAGVRAILLDGRTIDPSPHGFKAALRAALEIPEAADIPDALDAGGRCVLLIDTWERITVLDGWLRESFLPHLPQWVLVVIAGRNPPHPAWKLDPGWGELVQVVPLRNFRPDESEEYLRLRGVPETCRDDALSFTHGHPLALSLVADVLAQAPAEKAGLHHDVPDVVQVLLERFVDEVPSPTHRRALQICAHARATSERLLTEALDVEDARPFFDWLRELSFIELGPHGILPHDLARDVLEADLRYRNTDEYRDLHRRVRTSIVNRLHRSHGREQQEASFDLLYLHRNNPIMRPHHQWDAFGSAYADRASPADASDILAMVARHEGEESAGIARYWLGRQPEAFVVFRGQENDIIGFVATLQIQDATPDDRSADPAVAAAQGFVQQYGPARPGEVVIYHRFAMGRDSYQGPSAAWDMLVMTTISIWVSTPRLAWSFLTFADPDFWHPTMSYINVRRSPEADFAVGGRTYGVFSHDWRVQPPTSWLDVMSEREIDTRMNPAHVDADQPPPVIVLSEPQFRDAVRMALKELQRPDALQRNPLLRSRLVYEDNGDQPAIGILRRVIGEAIESLRGRPKDERLYRALYRTYVSPAATQEQAAESLDIPFSTYRYHLATGIERVTELLWQRELYGPDPS